MNTKRIQTWVVVTGIGLVILAASVWGLQGVRSAAYRQRLAQWIAPSSGVQLEHILQRKVDFIVDYYGFKYRGNTANYGDAHVFYYGAFEKPELHFIRDALAALPSGSIFVDVGANTGLYSVFVSKYAATVHSFEPFPPVLQRLNGIVAENGVSNVVIHPVGLGAEAASIPFFSPPEGNLGTGSFLSGFKHFQPANRDDHLNLQIVAGDDYFPAAGITQVDFVKIDIEGFEKTAIAGLRETLRRHRPLVLMETSVDPRVAELFKSLEEIRSAFPEKYVFVQIDGDRVSGSYWVQSIRSTFTRQDQFNLVAWPEEKDPLLPKRSSGDPAPTAN